MLLAARTSLLFAAAFVLTLILRRSSAASRHAVWLAAFAGVLALPAATALLPALRLNVLPGLNPERLRPVTIEYVQQTKSGATIFVPRKLAPTAIAGATSSPR